MRLKRLLCSILALTACATLASCKEIGDILPIPTPEATLEGERVSNVSKLSLDAKVQPKLEGYKELKQSSSYRAFYFNMGTINNVALNSADAVKYTGEEMKASYRLHELSSQEYEKNLNRAINLAIKDMDFTNSYLVSKKDGGWSLGQSQGTNQDVSYRLSTSSIKNSLDLDSNITKIGYSDSSLGSTYDSYRFSSYFGSYDKDYVLTGDMNYAYYRLSVLADCDAFAILVLDDTKNEAYVDYKLYPRKNLRYGIEVSRGIGFSDSLVAHYKFSLATVLDDLDYKPDTEDDEIVVSFVTNGGSYISPISVYYGHTIVKPVDPVRAGYTFMGWYTSSSFTDEFSFSTPITYNTTLYARWEENVTVHHDVEFYLYDSSYLPTVRVADGDKINKPADPKRDGYKFLGWYTDSTYSQEFVFPSYIYSNVTIYAKWEKLESINTHTVSFDSEGGSTVQSLSVNDGGTISKPANPTKSGCRFGGWYTSYTYDNEFDFNTQISNDITLYAKWYIDSNNLKLTLGDRHLYTDGIGFEGKIENKTGKNIYRIENVTIEIFVENTRRASAFFTSLDAYNLKNGETHYMSSAKSNQLIFPSRTLESYAWWSNHQGTLTYSYSFSYDAVLAPYQL